MAPITMGELLGIAITMILTLVACVAWLIRLEALTKQNGAAIEANAKLNDETSKESDNRMNKIEERTNKILDSIFAEIRSISQSVNDKFTTTSNAVAELKGILRGREDAPK